MVKLKEIKIMNVRFILRVKQYNDNIEVPALTCTINDVIPQAYNMDGYACWA